MTALRENKRLLKIREFFKSHTRRYLLRALWLFFPSLLFLLLAYFVFWHLTQGKDLMMITLENPKGKSTMIEFLCFVVALVFWVYVTWYSTRLVARAKHFMEPDNDPTWAILRVQTPRILAFSCITIIILAFFQLGNYGYPHLSLKESHVILFFSYAWYFLLYELWTLYLEVQRGRRNKKEWIFFLQNTRRGVFLLLIWFAVLMMFLKSFASVIAMLLVLQAGLVLLMIVRRELDETSTEEDEKDPIMVTPKSPLWQRMKHIIWYDENRKYVNLFMIMSFVGLGIYLASIINIRFAVFIGPFPFMLLAFGVLLGFGNFISYLSVLRRTNLHFFLFGLALLFGAFFDSHKLNLPSKNKELDPKFSLRQGLKEYFVHWINDPERKKILDDSTAPAYPVYFVMANGGASRSGYWTAQILSGLEDSSDGKFSKHLFCLSGASGGSVGNATFFSLLRARESLKAKGLSFSKASADYLKSDFLTFTIAHLLGPDVFRNIFPPLNYMEIDRGRALAMSLEQAPNKKRCFLYDSFKVKFSKLITQNDKPYGLPVICINATRMRDGNPAVFSNILIDSTNREDNYFNNRIDILSKLGETRDIKLSTAVVLGASFPYISPAGRIDNPLKVKNKKGGWNDETDSQYFVDGGYFDNSGAGVVNEMIFALNNMLEKDDSLKKYKRRLDFFVLHILNTDPKKENRDPINSVTNDLMAPAKTMMGSYGKQTTINDQRLKSYLYSLYGNNHHYKRIDLYDDPSDDFRFSMNWVISEYQLEKMKQALLNNKTYEQEKVLMKKWTY